MNLNRQTLDNLFANRQIDLRRGSLFDTLPGALSPGLSFSRIEGMMLGLAVGDALGITTEGKLPHERRDRYGEIRDYIPNRHDPRPMGFPSDDTQLAFWTLDQINTDMGFNPERVAERFCQKCIIGIGSTVKEFVRNYKSGWPWYQCGPQGAGNGALMRIALMLIPHLRSGNTDLWVDTALSAMMTHNDSGSIAACLAFINILWQLLRMESAPRPEWWWQTYVSVARELETGRHYHPRGGAFTDYSGPLWQFVEEKVPRAYNQNLSVREAGDGWYSGAFLLETVPSVIYILMRHGHDAEEAIVRAVNDTKDNDTVAAIVGAAMGALYGREEIPERWIKNLSGRTTHEDGGDDGRVFSILEDARRIWWDQGGGAVTTRADTSAVERISPSIRPAESEGQTAVITKDRFLGCFLGLACGDAVGTTVEFQRRDSFSPVTDMVGGGPFRLNPGEWTDDTSMALCLAVSLIERKRFDPQDQMRRYCRWRDEGYLSSNGRCFDIGGTVSTALRRFEETGHPFSGSSNPQAAGNGCIMRLAPVPMFFYPDHSAAIYFSGESSRTTHGATECIDACRLFGVMLFKALSGRPKDEILFGNHFPTGTDRFLSERIQAIADGQYRNKPESEIRGSGYVVACLEAALWCFYRTDNFRDAILKAVNLGEDADTTGAVCGQIAGAYYGEKAIPEAWCRRLAMCDFIVKLMEQLIEARAQT